jgi:cytochrome P450
MADTQTIEQPAPELYYDPYDYDVDINAQAVWKRLRDEAPLYHNEKFDFFAVSRYDDVLPVMLDTETYSSTHATTIELMGPEPAQIPMMIWMDPPNHTRFRQLVNRAFTPRAITDLEQRIARVCAQLLDPHLGAGTFDYVDQFAALLPPTVILALLGFPEGHESAWRAGVDELFHVEEGGTGFAVGDDGLPQGIADPNGAMNAALFHLLPEIMADRRANPSDDLMSMLVNSEFEDADGTRRKIDEVEFNSFIQMIAIAGTETVARLLSWAAVVLARNPDQRALLVEDPSLIANGVEELLRYEAPSPVNARWVTRDVEFHGGRVPAGSKLVMLNGAGNRDERHFPDPDRFDVRRQIDRHLSFGYGAHFCIGAALARLEGRVALQETLARIPTWEIDESRIEWVHTSTVRGFAKVPISF